MSGSRVSRSEGAGAAEGSAVPDTTAIPAGGPTAMGVAKTFIKSVNSYE
jgi:hypothetical protein